VDGEARAEERWSLMVDAGVGTGSRSDVRGEDGRRWGRTAQPAVEEGAGGGRSSRASPGCIVLDGGPAGEPLGFAGVAGWSRLRVNRDGASPARGGDG
jgi:hypothetical protein